MNSVWLVGGVFFIVYALIVTERVHRTISALLGGLTMVLLGVISQEQAFSVVDWNVIFLLAGMMLIANILRETGLFQWIAMKAVILGKGNPFQILIILSFVTAVSSAFLDNVTIVVLVVPVTLFVASSLQVSPIPFLIAEILASNIGGMATLVGDPPNVLIASAAGIDFVNFVANMAPLSGLILFSFVGLSWLMFKKELRANCVQPYDIEHLDSSDLITNRPLLRKALIVMALVIVGFLLHGALRLKPATIAMAGATALLLWSKVNPENVFREIEWTTLFFFIGLFITVEAMVKVGLIDLAARELLRLTHGSLTLNTMLVLWLSAFASGIVDNIPYTATMIPVVESLGQTVKVQPLWWALAAGADLGGNATLVGASANVVVASLAARSGRSISFKSFLGYGLLTTAMSLVIATVYIWLRYL